MCRELGIRVHRGFKMDLPEVLDIPPEDTEQRRDQPRLRLLFTERFTGQRVDACAHREEYVG